MGLSMLLPKESQASAGYQVTCRCLIMAVCGMDAATPLSVQQSDVLVPAVTGLFLPEDIWPAIVHGMLLGTKAKVIGPGAPAVLDLKPRSKLEK